MVNEHVVPRIRVIGLTLEFYQQNLPDFISRLQVQFETLKKEIATCADITGSRLCWTEKQVREEIECAERDTVDALLLLPMSYTASLMSVPALVHTHLPLVVWNTQEAETIDESYSQDDLLMNHVAQGTQDVTNVLWRQGRQFCMESGHYKDPHALARLRDWLLCVGVFKREIRTGILGEPFEGMGDFACDESEMARAWGSTIVRLSVADFADRLTRIDDDRVKAVMASDRERYEISDDLDDGTFFLSVKMELALRELVQDERLDAFTMNFRDFLDDGAVATMPFLGINKLMAEGLGYAGEGDIMTAALMAQMKRLCGAATFTEIYTIDYRKNRMMMCHMQECCSAMARKDRRIRLLKKDFWVPDTRPYAGMHFTLEPGPVTLCAVTPDKDRHFRFILHEAAIDDIEPLPNFDVPHWLVIPRMPVADFLTAYSKEGGPHHLTAVPGHMRGRIAKLASLYDFAVVEVAA